MDNWDDAGQPPSPTRSHLELYLRELPCHPEEVLGVMRIVFSESIVFRLHLAFCFSPVLEQRENS